MHDYGQLWFGMGDLESRIGSLQNGNRLPKRSDQEYRPHCHGGWDGYLVSNFRSLCRYLILIFC